MYHVHIYLFTFLIISNVSLYGMGCKRKASALQIYQLLSTQQQFPLELRQLIVLKAYAAIQQEDYWLKDIGDVLRLIRRRSEVEKDIPSTVYMVKKCLDYCDKSLVTMRAACNETVFHTVMHERFNTEKDFKYVFDVLCQVVDTNITAILCIEDKLGYTPWGLAVHHCRTHAIKKFIKITRNQQLRLPDVGCHPTTLYIAKAKRNQLAKWIDNPEYKACAAGYQHEFDQLQTIIELLEAYNKRNLIISLSKRCG